MRLVSRPSVDLRRRLVPIKQEQWTAEVCEGLWLDNEVRVRVHKVRQHPSMTRRTPASHKWAKACVAAVVW